MEKRNVKLGRKGRAASGFDIRIGDQEFSHRTLIARAIASVMEQDYRAERKLPEYDNAKLAKSILDRSEQASKLTPEEMLKVI